MSIAGLRPDADTVPASSPPHRQIARSWNGGPLPLGLDAPLALLGGDRLAPDRLAADLALDWAPELQAAVTQASHRQHAAGRDWFTMPPCVVTGVAGIGRTLMARRIARCAGVPFATIDVSAQHGGSAFGGQSPAPDIRLPSRIATVLATSACANPVVLITGIESAAVGVIGLVQAMMDPATSSHWNEPSIGAVIDLSQVSWMVQSTSLLGVPRLLAHIPRIDIALDDERRRLRDLTIVSETMDDFGVDPRSVAKRAAALLEPLRASTSQNAAELRAVAERALWALSRTTEMDATASRTVAVRAQPPPARSVHMQNRGR